MIDLPTRSPEASDPTREDVAAYAPTDAAGGERAPAQLDFDTLYRAERERVMATVRSVIGPSDELEDVVQLVFIEILRCLPRFEGRSKLSTWIYRIAVNVALQHLRKKKRKRWLLLGATGDEHTRRPARGDAVRRLEDREALGQVYAAVDALSEKKRAVWVLHEMQGLAPREIAEVLEVPMNTVRSRLLAARSDLMDELRRRGVVPTRGDRSGS